MWYKVNDASTIPTITGITWNNGIKIKKIKNEVIKNGQRYENQKR